jgi:hypothetical protein
MATATGIYRDLHPQYLKYVYFEFGVGSPEQISQTNKTFIKAMKVGIQKINGVLGERDFICGERLVWMDFALA